MAKSSKSGSGSPLKYTIRAALIWMIPVVSAVIIGIFWLPVLLSAALTPVELPKLRQRLFGSRARKALPCLKAPALIRLVALWVVQAWWIMLWRTGVEAADDAVPPVKVKLDQDAPSPARDGRLRGVVTRDVGRDSGSGAADVKVDPNLKWVPRTISVVLPCAGEGEFALKTVRAVSESTPREALEEIIVVDDGSDPPLGDTHLTDDVRRQYNVRLLRHDRTVGLIGAKKDGGAAAAGDLVVFFDCHVAPQKGWHTSFLRLVGENYRRIVVPIITDLDVSTWTQRGYSGGQAKCYLTWDADFKWFDSNDIYVPVISGGLLGISRRWWNETGGYDERMAGWGGENLDQSLRSWLCGGEIVVARDARVAHMWRVDTDARTRAHYAVDPMVTAANRMRAAVAWFGDFSEKLKQFPALSPGRLSPTGGPWYGDVDNILAVKRRLNCKSFAWFMHRFKDIYEEGGLIPRETYILKATGRDLCLTYDGQAGTNPQGHGIAELRPCEEGNDRQRWHGANRDRNAPDQACCGGIRAWNTDQCLSRLTSDYIETFVCDISGRTKDQVWRLDDTGQLRSRATGVEVPKGSREPVDGYMKVDKNAREQFGDCVEIKRGFKTFQAVNCRVNLAPPWMKENPLEPIESRLYRRSRRNDWAESGPRPPRGGGVRR